jgi:hypothetical protein
MGNSSGAARPTTPARPQADDYAEELLNIASGLASSAGGTSELADGLLEATALLTKLGVLLSEASADDWREVRPRLVALRTAIKAMPKTAPRRKRVGY